MRADLGHELSPCFLRAGAAPVSGHGPDEVVECEGLPGGREVESEGLGGCVWEVALDVRRYV